MENQQSMWGTEKWLLEYGRQMGKAIQRIWVSRGAKYSFTWLGYSEELQQVQPRTMATMMAGPSLLYDEWCPPHLFQHGRLLTVGAVSQRHPLMSRTLGRPAGWRTQWCHPPSPVFHWVTASHVLLARRVTSSAGPVQPTCTCGTYITAMSSSSVWMSLQFLCCKDSS